MERTAPSLLRRLTRPLLGLALATLMAGCVTGHSSSHWVHHDHRSSYRGYDSWRSQNSWRNNNTYHHHHYYSDRDRRHRERHCEKRDVRWYQPWRSRC